MYLGTDCLLSSYGVLRQKKYSQCYRKTLFHPLLLSLILQRLFVGIWISTPECTYLSYRVLLPYRSGPPPSAPGLRVLNSSVVSLQTHPRRNLRVGSTEQTKWDHERDPTPLLNLFRRSSWGVQSLLLVLPQHVTENPSFRKDRLPPCIGFISTIFVLPHPLLKGLTLGRLCSVISTLNPLYSLCSMSCVSQKSRYNFRTLNRRTNTLRPSTVSVNHEVCLGRPVRDLWQDRLSVYITRCLFSMYALKFKDHRCNFFKFFVIKITV